MRVALRKNVLCFFGSTTPFVIVYLRDEPSPKTKPVISTASSLALYISINSSSLSLPIGLGNNSVIYIPVTAEEVGALLVVFCVMF